MATKGTGPRGSALRGIVARGRWMLADASLRARPERPATAATPDDIRAAEVKIDALGDRLAILAEEHDKLSASSRPSQRVARDAWREAVGRLEDEKPVRRRAPIAAGPGDSRAARSRIEDAVRAHQDTLSGLQESRRALESTIAELRTQAEAAVAAGNDVRALRELSRKRGADAALSALDHEVRVREELLAEWQRLLELFDAELSGRRRR